MRDSLTDRSREGDGLNRFEQGNFSPELVYSPGLTEDLGPHQEHRQRIEKELSEFLSAQEARETAACVYNLAIEIDDEIDKILKDPLVRRLYEYDGKLFTPRGTRRRIRWPPSAEIAERFQNRSVLPWERKTLCDPVAAEGAGHARLGGQETKDELGGIAYVGPGAERGARSNYRGRVKAQERGRSRPARAVSRRTSFLPIVRGANGKTGMRRRLDWQKD